MSFSKRSSFASGESIEFSRLLDRKKKDGVPFLDLTESNPTRCGFSSLDSRLLEPFQDPRNLIYAPDPQGLLEAREAVSAYYASKNITVPSDRIFLTSGTSEAYTFLFHLLADAGDEILCVSPGYPLFEHLASMADVNLIHGHSHPETGWKWDAKKIEKARTARTRALILVNPNNPTGNYPELYEGPLPLISDEVFLDFHWDGAPRRSAASLSRTLTFTLSGVSKILGSPQMKLSWIVVGGPDAACREACRRLEVIADAYLSVNTPSQRALGLWLDRRSLFIDEARSRVVSNFETLSRELKGESAKTELLRPEGGWYAVLKLDAGRTDEETASYLLKEKNVLVQPGYFYDFESEYLVLSLLPEPEKFLEAACRLSQGLAA